MMFCVNESQMFDIMHHHTIKIQLLAHSLTSFCFTNYCAEYTSYLSTDDLIAFFKDHSLVVSSQITRQIVNVKMVGLAMALFAIVEVITTAVSWKLADRVGNVVMLGIAVAAEILGAVSALYMNVHQGGWIFLPTAFFAVMDTIYQTECVSLVGKYFRSELEEASATYRFIQGLGSSLSSFVTPLFVTGDASASTQTQLTYEMAVAVLLAIISYLLVCLFVKIYEKKRPN